IEDLRSVGPITIAIDFLTNRILSQLAFDVRLIHRYLRDGEWIVYNGSAIWPLSRYLQDSFSIQYDDFGKQRLEFTFYINGMSTVKTISSDFLSILIVLLITLLALLVPI
ncbi:hypothetical protein D5086_014351, partial [Populus alba]